MEHIVYLIVKIQNQDAICAIIYVDEFIVTEKNEKVVEVIENVFKNKNCNQISIINFDVENIYVLEKNFISKNKFKFWEDSNVDCHPVWKNRTKCIIISKSVNDITFVHNVLYGKYPTNNEGNYIERDYKNLRLLHFRKPNLLNSEGIKFVENKIISNKLKK